MRNIFLAILITQISLISFAQTNKDTIKEVLTVANSGLAGYLKKIPQGEESYYGFKSRNEFSLVQFGNPYHVYALKNEFYTVNKVEDKDYFLHTEEWRVPVKVNGEYRVLLTIAKMKGKWTAVSFGSAMLAKELFDFEQKHPVSQNGILLTVYKPVCDFILFPSDGNTTVLKAFPVTSAVAAFGISNKNITEFSLENVLKMIKSKTN